ncbi:MAG TPA: DUF6496 domain-containing protein [Alphaproteobacteria bacterium]
MASSRQKRKTGKVMHEYKHGQLKSGGRRKVKSRRQAIAIAMSESGQSRNRRKRGRGRSTGGRRSSGRSRK